MPAPETRSLRPRRWTQPVAAADTPNRVTASDPITGDVKEVIARSAELVDSNVEEVQDIVLDAPPPLADRDLMSPSSGASRIGATG